MKPSPGDALENPDTSRDRVYRSEVAVQPQFFFHVTTACDILRHCGVDLVKKGFLGTPDSRGRPSP
jgi:Domain of unknown function (DUF1993)